MAPDGPMIPRFSTGRLAPTSACRTEHGVGAERLPEAVSRAGPLVIVVVLNWNKAAQTVACVAALPYQTHKNLRIIIVDNGSTEGSLYPLDKLAVPFVLIRNENNLGFTGGVNVGIDRALAEGADYVWLLNNDAQAAPSALEAMLTIVEADKTIGMASPLIRNADAGDEVEFCGGVWERSTFRTTDDLLTYKQWSETSPKRIWLVGTAVLLRRQLVETIGGFDDRFFAYWEDNDYSVRSARAGYRNVVVPDAVVRHWSGTPKTNPQSKPAHYYYYMARNEIFFYRKHTPLSGKVKLIWWAINRQFRRIETMTASAGLINAVYCGVGDGLLGRGGAYDPEKQHFRLLRYCLTAALGRRQ
jgi:GT2 family glycosyltransferase